ncbi:MAG: hypothetical protein E7265_04555 [Lachnospiraceae bacterium]|nr:hypothetical protein [Lachnospiraceae bacterium]
MIKKIGYILFAMMYYIGCIRPVNPDKYFCVMTHDGSKDSSVGVVIEALRQKNPKAEFTCVRKDSRGGAGLINLIFRMSFALSVSGTVLMDNEFLPLAYTVLRKEVKVVQLWHGTGSIKKIGRDANEGNLLALEKKADKRITHLIANSDYTAKLHGNAFGVVKDNVYLTGIPRTDIMFDERKRRECIAGFFKKYPKLNNKRMVLYAPTFRDDKTDNPDIGLDLGYWCDNTDENTVLLLRLHPHVASAYDDSDLLRYGDRIVNVSGHEDLNTLLFVADILITDYSSIVFEYALLDRPIIFFAYDLAEYSDYGRGLYEDFEKFAPGKIVTTTEEVVNELSNRDIYSEIRKKFIDKYYKYLDGCSTKRLVELLFK